MAKREMQMENLEKEFNFDTHQFNSIEDYNTWNMHARNAFRQAKKANPKCDPPIAVRVPDEKFHKKIKVKFQRFDQTENISKVRLRNNEIDWRGELKPGHTYELALPVVKFLNNLTTPIFAEVRVEGDGDHKTETKQVGENNRFSCHLIDIAV